MYEIRYETEKNAIKTANLEFCRGFSLEKFKKSIGEMLDFIGRNDLFKEYTKHDMSHAEGILQIIDWLIPENTKKIMTTAEWLMLTLAVYMHDLGMVVSKQEFDERNQNELFEKFKVQYVKKNNYETINKEEDIYQEFVRINHASRIRAWIEGNYINKYGVCMKQFEILSKELENIKPEFKDDLAIICESHNKDDYDNFTKYPIEKRYGSSDQEVVNLNYIAIILRSADLLHITNDRTPVITSELSQISNPISIVEWEKQKAVSAIYPKKERNEEGNIDDSIQKNTIEVHAYFSDSESAEGYFMLSSYLQYAEKELLKCHVTAEKAKKQEGSKYDFPWKKIDTNNIVTKGFEAKKLSFTLEQESILRLLVGHTLYNDSSVVVRELTQNAIDAVRLQSHIDNKSGQNKKGKVFIEWNSNERILSFSDNGTGMTIFDIENYLLKVGASKYREKQIIENYSSFSPISRFGIGILTCFLIADDIDIETNSSNDEFVNEICLRKVNGKYLLKKKNKDKASNYISSHGTIIKLYVRKEIDMSNLEYNLKKWIVCPEVEVVLSIDGKENIKIGKKNLSGILTDYLIEKGYKVDGQKIKVEEKCKDGVTVACALRYNSYMSDWSFMNCDESDPDKLDLTIGTCVEGIRVEFLTPGYKKRNILAIADIKNSKYKTNVARTALEYDYSSEVLKTIYDCYKLFIEEQINNLESNNFSKSWALEECHYIMGPLLGYEFSDSVEPVDRLLLLNSMSDIKCFFVEADGKRSILSPNEAKKYKKFDIIECKLVNFIELILKETPCDATVSQIVKVIGNNKILNIENPFISNFDERNVLHKEILNDREVEVLSVDSKNRQIKMTFVNNSNNIWSEYTLSGLRRYREKKNIYIPNGDFKIEGLKDEVGVKTIGGIYLNSDSKLCKYVKEMTEKILANQDTPKRNNLLLRVFLNAIFNNKFLDASLKKEDSNMMLKKIFEHASDEVVKKLWNIVDKELFVQNVLVEKNKLFSLDNWTRHYESEFDFDFE